MALSRSDSWPVPLGYTRNRVARAVTAGRLHCLYRGVYAVGHTRLTQQGRCLAAVLACGPGAVLSHDSAAWLWGISTKSPFPPAVIARLARMIERSEELRLFDLAPVEPALERNKGHHGFGALRHAIVLYRPAPFNRSGLERRFLALVQEAGLPQASTGYNELGFELDAYWPEQRFAIELDAFETHGTRAAFERDRLRQRS